MMNFQTIRKNPWPFAIMGWFLLFGSAMAAWVVVAVRNDPELVRPDYYEQEITYQKQIDRLARTAAVRSQVSIAYEHSRGQVVLQIPTVHLADLSIGTIHFYRPSNAKLDFDHPLAVDGKGSQLIPVSNLQGGLWKVRVEWTAGGQEFFHDQSLVL
jgi:nitrogen fixation protein FixH